MLNFTCDKTELLAAAGTVIRAVPGKSSLPALEGILLEASGDELKLTGYDLKMAIRVAVKAEVMREGDVILNAKLLLDILRKMPDGDVTVECGENLATAMRCGDTHYSLSALDAGDYPDLPDVGGEPILEIREDVLKDMIGHTVFAVSASETRVIQTGELFDIKDGKLNVVACDGFRLAIRTEAVDTATDGKLVIAGNILAEVERICGNTDDLVCICVTDKHAQFRIGPVELIGRRLEGEFFDYGKAIPADLPIVRKVDTKALLSSIDRVTVVVNEKLKSPVRCVVKENEIELSAHTAAGSARDRCAAEGSGDGLEIGFNGRYLYEAIRYAPEAAVTMRFQSARSPCVITGASGDGKFLQLVLPVRLTA